MEEKIELAAEEIASRSTRLGSALIDMIPIIAITLPLSYALGLFDYIEAGQQPPLGLTAISAIAGFTIYFALNGKLLAQNGQTIGKKYNNIKIVTLEGDKPSIQHLLLKRYLPYFGFPYLPIVGGIVNLINLCWIFGKSKRCLHDHIAGTKVING
jgi:uncharacterized RDD family membrane protein YckC